MVYLQQRVIPHVYICFNTFPFPTPALPLSLDCLSTSTLTGYAL